MKTSAIHQAAYYALGIVMMKGISLLMIPFVTRQLSPTEYGTLEILLVFADISTLIIGFGLVEALNRFVGLSGKENGESRTLISQCFILAIFVCMTVMLILYFSASNIINVLPAKVSQQQLFLIAFPALLEGVIAIPLTLMRMKALAKYFCLLNVLKAFLQAILIVVLLNFDLGINAILIAGAISSLFLVLCLLPYQWQKMDKAWYSDWYKQGFKSVYWQRMIEILSYGAPIVLGRLGLFAMTGLDRWLLADKVGIEQLAVYAIAVKFALILILLLQPFGLWWFPNRFTFLKQANGREECARYAMLGTNLGLILGFIMLITLPTFMKIILPVAYHDAALIVMALLTVNMIKNAGDLLNQGCFINSSMSQMWVQWLCAILAVIGYVLFIEDYGVWAAASVLFIVYSIRLILFFFYSQSVLRLPYQHKTWLFSTLLGVVVVVIYYQGLYSVTFTEVDLLNLGLSFTGATLLSFLYLIILIVYKVLPNPIFLWQQRQGRAVIS